MNATDSGFGCLLRTLSRAQQATVTVHRARCGRRRVYLSESAALAYDDTFTNHPHQPEGPMPSPAWDGWFDAEQMSCDIDEARREAAEARSME